MSVGKNMDNKVQMLKEANEAYAKLISIAYKLDLKHAVTSLQKERNYICRKIDRSKLPNC